MWADDHALLTTMKKFRRLAREFDYWDTCVIGPLREEVTFRYVAQYFLPWMFGASDLYLWVSWFLFVVLHFCSGSPYMIFARMPLFKIPALVLMYYKLWKWNEVYGWWVSLIGHMLSNH